MQNLISRLHILKIQCQDDRSRFSFHSASDESLKGERFRVFSWRSFEDHERTHCRC
jgi:hypothetical protein